MSDDVQVTEKVLEPSKARNSPKTSKETWFQVRMEYEKGTFTSVKELADRYGIHPKTLFTRISTENWREQRQAILVKAQAKIEEKAVDRVSEYLSKSFSTALKYERIIEVSQEQHGSKSPDGTPILDSEAIDQYTRSSARVHALALSALRVPTVASVDITSKGLSIGDSIVSAIARLRESGNAPAITEEQAARIIECEVVDGPRS